MLRCPRDISSYCDEILHLTLEYLSYDPNFTDNMDEDIDEEILEEDEDEYVHSRSGSLLRLIRFFLLIKSLVKFCCSESANEYTDDEDVSWKVRRAAAKCLAALVVTRPEMLSKLYEQV